MSRLWKSYKHRFVPWLAMNWKTRQIKKVDLKSDLLKEECIVSQLRALLESLSHTHPNLSVVEQRRLLSRFSDMARLVLEARKEMKRLFGFALRLKESLIEGGGRGVFITRDSGAVRPGQLIGLYPGTVYSPSDPILIQSLNNSYIFRCSDGWMIDGKNHGISSWIYKSCAYRDVIGPYMSCDLSWLSASPVNPLSIGQFVNNHTHSLDQNVEYIEVNIPQSFPQKWMRFLPNVHYSSPPVENDQMRSLRLVGLMSTRTIQPEEELYSSYLTIVTP